MPKPVTKLSRQQRRFLETVARFEASGEPGNDCSGDLSICSANLPATHHSLVRRGLVDAEYDHYMHPEDGPWFYRLTEKGRLALEGVNA